MAMTKKCKKKSAKKAEPVDISLKPLDFWLGAHDFLAKSFAWAYETNDGNLLNDPAISEALCILMTEPRALCRTRDSQRRFRSA